MFVKFCSSYDCEKYEEGEVALLGGKSRFQNQLSFDVPRGAAGLNLLGKIAEYVHSILYIRAKFMCSDERINVTRLSHITERASVEIHCGGLLLRHFVALVLQRTNLRSLILKTVMHGL